MGVSRRAGWRNGRHTLFKRVVFRATRTWPSPSHSLYSLGSVRAPIPSHHQPLAFAHTVDRERDRIKQPHARCRMDRYRVAPARAVRVSGGHLRRRRYRHLHGRAVLQRGRRRPVQRRRPSPPRAAARPAASNVRLCVGRGQPERAHCCRGVVGGQLEQPLRAAAFWRSLLGCCQPDEGRRRWWWQQ
jgi:hypothetical protein